MQICTANLLSLLHFAWIHIKKLFAFSMSVRVCVCVCVCVCMLCRGSSRNGIPGVQENHKTLALKEAIHVVQLPPSFILKRQPRPREVM